MSGGRVRVYELARQVGIPSKEMVAKLKEVGVDVKNHMTTLDEETAELVLSELLPIYVLSREGEEPKKTKKKRRKVSKEEKKETGKPQEMEKCELVLDEEEEEKRGEKSQYTLESSIQTGSCC